MLSESDRGDAILTHYGAWRTGRIGSPRARPLCGGRVSSDAARAATPCHALGAGWGGLGASFLMQCATSIPQTAPESAISGASVRRLGHLRVRVRGRPYRGRMSSDARRAATPPPALGAGWEGRGASFLT